MKSLFNADDITDREIESLFFLTAQMKSLFLKESPKKDSEPLSISIGSSKKPSFASLSEALLYLREKSFLLLQAFFEPSTRTRISFEVAARKLGLSVMTEDFVSRSSSQDKGEVPADTLDVLEAMRPDLLVVRWDGNEDIKKKLKDFSFPFINAGAGLEAHPTQALLDVFSLQELRGHRGKNQKKILEGEKVLIVGDVCHSRVAFSQKLLFERLGAQVAICAPKLFVTQHPLWKFWAKTTFFPHLKEGLKWCSVCVALRWQEERHSPLLKKEFKLHSFQLNEESLKELSSDSLIFHPGPIIWGKEISASMKRDPRLQALRQVENGVFLRMALLFKMILD